MSNRIGRYQLDPIFYAGLVWVGVGLFGKEQTTFFILGLAFMAMGLKRIEDPTPKPDATDSPEPAPDSH